MPNIDDAIKIDVGMFESAEIKDLALTMLATLRIRHKELDEAKQLLAGAADDAERKLGEAKVRWIEDDIRRLRSMLDAAK